MVAEDIEKLARLFVGANKKCVVGILVGQSKESFANTAKDKANELVGRGYRIILTDIDHVCSDLIQYQFDNSFNSGGESLELRIRRAEVNNNMLRQQAYRSSGEE